MCTLTFLKDVLAGKKELMLMKRVVGVPDIPRIREINCQVIWEDIKHEEKINRYFPDIFVKTSRTPDRAYMFNVP